MNANELADELYKCMEDGSTDLVCVEQAATMLRQQQAEIEALKKEAALQRLSDFTQEADNEPVAHFYPEGEGCTVYDIKFAWKVTGTTEPIPLYTHPPSLVDWSYQQGYKVGKETHPAKTLTDDEIDDVLYSMDWAHDPVEFARAILRKAQEK